VNDGEKIEKSVMNIVERGGSCWSVRPKTSFLLDFHIVHFFTIFGLFYYLWTSLLSLLKMKFNI
jgi:hypothetical protein